MINDQNRIMQSSVEMGNISLQICGELNDWQTQLHHRVIEPGVDALDITLTADQHRTPPEFKLIWEFPIIDVLGAWTATGYKDKGIEPDWGNMYHSQLGIGAPLFCFFGGMSRNRLTCAVSDTLNSLEIKKGVNEESANFHCHIHFFKGVHAKIKEYTVTVRFDQRNIPYYQSLAETAQWWSEFYPPDNVPLEAWQPVYSSWYAFHQNLKDVEIETQCKLSRELGCASVIIDDGWQTADNSRGYAYCGDWKICLDRFPDMHNHVKRVHDLGLKYLLWYSVPFVGCHSRAFKRFKGKYLHFNEQLNAAILDPRFPDVRAYIIETYTKAMNNWDLDGFKLDFIDQFCLPPNIPDPAQDSPGARDIPSIPQAVNRLMIDVQRNLSKIKPDVLIEFRQNYTGPAMLQYGNMFRAADCPNDALANRIRTVDIRLLVATGATHADMLMWNPHEPVESAARQLINIIFAVPQISVKLDTIPAEHFAMLKFYLNYQRIHQDVFLHGTFCPMAPESNYPWILATNKDKQVIAVYTEQLLIPVQLNSATMLIIINGSCDAHITMDIKEAKPNARWEIFDVTGNLVEHFSKSLTIGLHKLKVPISGILQISFEK